MDAEPHDRLRILIATDHYPPFIGGAHRQSQLLARELAGRGHVVQVATVGQDDLPAVEVDGNISVFRVGQLRSLFRWLRTGRRGVQRHQPPFPDPVSVWALRDRVRSFAPDIVHAYGWIAYSMAVGLWGSRVPLIISGRDYAYTCATRTMMLGGQRICDGPALARCLGCSASYYGPLKGTAATAGVFLSKGLLRRRIQGVHSISQFVREIVSRDFIGASAPMIEEAVIPSFREDVSPTVDARPAHDVARYLDLLPAVPFILFVGALRRVKGVDVLLDAYRALRQPPPLVLIGTQERDTPTTFPPGVHVLSDFPHAAVMEAWKRSLFGVLPSLWPEPLGSVVYEGMSAGKAVIGTKPGGHADMIVDGETGLLVPAGDRDALRIAMQRLLDHPADREALGRSALVRAELFTAHYAVPRFEQLYRRTMQRALEGVR